MHIYEFDKFQLDLEQKYLLHDGEIISLQPKVFDMLIVFIRRNGELVSREDLMQAVWSGTFVEESNLRFCIHALRKALGKNAVGKNYIETVPKRGYRFTAQIKEISGGKDENHLSRYKILKKIGAGGMGEVFLARDPQLERNVALKVLLPEIARDDERIRRFKLEAKAVSALNHPNIVTIYEIGEEQENLFIAYEFIEGETVREKIKKNQFTVAECINVAEQVANALAVAHKADIIHRDIKPENIIIRDDGYVKLLDFGLAKRNATSLSTDDAETLEWVKTQNGLILGSVQYMSPEQARGLEIDERTDVWSLGVVLYEMLSGKNPFDGATVSDSVAAILHLEPESIGKYLDDIPEELGIIIENALSKNLAQRYQNIKHFSDDLRNVRRRLSNDVLTKRITFEESNQKTVEFLPRITDEKASVYQEKENFIHDFTDNESKNAVNKKSRFRLKKRFLFSSIALSLIALAVLYFLSEKYFLPYYYDRFQKTRITQITDDAAACCAAVSDDRKWLAFVRQANGKRDLIVRELETGIERRAISIAEGEILQPTFSPVESQIFFVVKKDGNGILYGVDYKHGSMYSSPQITNVDSRVSFSPDGKNFAFIRQHKEGGSSVIISSAGVYSDNSAVIEKLTTEKTRLTKFDNVFWQNGGEEFTVRGWTNFDETSGSGETYETAKSKNVRIGLGEQIEWTKNNSLFSLGFFDLSFQPPSWFSKIVKIQSELDEFSSFDASKDGKTVVVSTVRRYPALWSFDPKTKENKQIFDGSFGIDSNMGSGILQTPDGRLIFAKASVEQTENISVTHETGKGKFDYKQKPSQIFSSNLDGTDQRQLTHCENSCLKPIATDDGKYILYQEIINSDKGIKRMNADGSNPVQLTTEPDMVEAITPDGKTVIFTRHDLAEQSSKWLKMSIDGGAPSPFTLENDSEPRIGNLKFFGGGKYLAYLFVQPTAANSKYQTKLKTVSFDRNQAGKLISERDFDGYGFSISPDEKWIVSRKKDGFSRFPLNLTLTKTAVEQILQTEESDLITDFIWQNDGERVFYLKPSNNGNIFLIEDIE